MTEKNKKRLAIAVMIGAFIAAVWWLTRRQATVALPAASVDTQDSYYLTGNQTPIVMPGSGSSVAPSNIDLGDMVNNYGASQSQLDALGDRICGCVNSCGGSNGGFDQSHFVSQGMGSMFDAALNIPTLPNYMQEYVAPDLSKYTVAAPVSSNPGPTGATPDNAYVRYKNNPYSVAAQNDSIFADDTARGKNELSLRQMEWAL